MIDHYAQDIAGEIDRLTNQRGVDVVIEHVGEAAAAHRHLENGKPFGKVVLEV